LRDMDEKEWMTSSWDVDETQGPPRRVYRLSAQGNEVLGAYMQDLRQTHEQIGDLMDAYHRHMEEGKGEHH
jgi:DNA-binding PadR family transcriptional regulator